MVDTWKEVAFKDEVAALGTATPAATDGSAASANQCTMEEAMTIISLVQADLNASFVNKQRAPQ